VAAPYDADMARDTYPSRRTPAIPASVLVTPTRPNFFDGKLLTADDFRLEQDYQDHKRHLQNLATLGAGVVSGLEVSADADGVGITVSPGLAIDALGREIIVPVATRVPWPTPDGTAPRRWGVVIELALHPADPDPDPATDGWVSSTTVEGAMITVLTERPAPDDGCVVLRRYGRGSAGKSRRR
jgi:hypothetical protein